MNKLCLLSLGAFYNSLINTGTLGGSAMGPHPWAWAGIKCIFASVHDDNYNLFESLILIGIGYIAQV